MIYILLSTIAYSLFIMANTVAARLIHPVFAAALVTGVSVTVPVIIALRERAVSFTNAQGVWAALVAGVFIAFYSIFLNKSFAVEKVGVVVPIVYGGSIIISTILSIALFKERVGLLQGAGILMMIIGIIVVVYARILSGSEFVD